MVHLNHFSLHFSRLFSREYLVHAAPSRRVDLSFTDRRKIARSLIILWAKYSTETANSMVRDQDARTLVHPSFHRLGTMPHRQVTC